MFMDCIVRQPLQIITQTKTLTHTQTHISLHKHTRISFLKTDKHSVYFSYIQNIYHLFSFILPYFFSYSDFFPFLLYNPPPTPRPPLTPHSPFFLPIIFVMRTSWIAYCNFIYIIHINQHIMYSAVQIIISIHILQRFGVFFTHKLKFS